MLDSERSGIPAFVGGCQNKLNTKALAIDRLLRLLELDNLEASNNTDRFSDCVQSDQSVLLGPFLLILRLFTSSTLWTQISRKGFESHMEVSRAKTVEPLVFRFPSHVNNAILLIA